MADKDVDDLINKGNALYNSGIFKEAIKYYAEAARLEPDNADAFNNWGVALYDLAKTKHDETLFKESFEKFAISMRLKPDNSFSFCNRGYALYYFAEIKQDKSLFGEAAECFKKSKLDILDILVFLDEKAAREHIVQTNVFFPLLDYDTDDAQFFKEATKNIKGEVE
jgi:tetratricopeptide (TPR) repeat protein